jgi:hypothetical protein
VQPTASTHDYASFIGKKVAMDYWTVQRLHHGISPSMTRTLPANTILPNKSQPFSIMWADNTDSNCDLPCLLTYNHAATPPEKTKHDASRRPAEALVGFEIE